MYIYILFINYLYTYISNIRRMDTNFWPGFTSHHHFALFSRARRRGAHRVDSLGRCVAGSVDAARWTQMGLLSGGSYKDLWVFVWVNYNDLTVTSLESWLIGGFIPKWPYFTLVNYYHLPRFICLVKLGARELRKKNIMTFSGWQHVQKHSEQPKPQWNESTIKLYNPKFRAGHWTNSYT